MRLLVGLLVSLFVTVPVSHAVSTACEPIEGVPDYNCDGRVVIVMFGDSVTTGYGDTDIGKKLGGYVARAQTLMPTIEFINLSEQGERSPLYMSKLNEAFGPKPTGIYLKIKQSLMVADYVVQDVGRNDRWYRNAPAWSLSNLKYAANLISVGVKKFKGTPPMIITPNLTVPDRNTQREWVRGLNRLILRSSTDSAPADLRLDRLELSLLRYDRIHPTSAGYAKLAEIFRTYLTNTLPVHVKKSKRLADRQTSAARE